MTSQVVVDSGIFLATALAETYSSQAKALVKMWETQNANLVAPTLFQYEIVAVLRKQVNRGLISPADALKAQDYLLDYPVQLYMNKSLLKRAYELATKYNRPTAYDSQYLAVAEHLACDFWTADEKMFNALDKDLPYIKWLGNFTV